MPNNPAAPAFCGHRRCLSAAELPALGKDLALFLLIASAICLAAFWLLLPMERSLFVGATVLAESTMIAAGLVFWGINARKSWPCVVLAIITLLYAIGFFSMAVLTLLRLGVAYSNCAQLASIDELAEQCDASMTAGGTVLLLCLAGVLLFAWCSYVNIKLRTCIDHPQNAEQATV